MTDTLTVTRADIEDFTYFQSALLDDWRLDEWLTYFDDDAHYVVPPLGADPQRALEMDPYEGLPLIADDLAVLQARVTRLNSLRAHAEQPRSHVRHFDTNVRLVSSDGDQLVVHSNLSVSRWRHDRLDTYVGRLRQTLRIRPDGASPEGCFRVVERRVVLDVESLDPVGPISFIL